MTGMEKADQSFVHLVDCHLNHVHRYLCNLLRDEEVARDQCHETFLSLRRQIDREKDGP